jgi:hypothetical protein
MTNRDAGLLTFRALSIYAVIRALEQTEWVLYRWHRMPPDAGFDAWIYLDLFAPFLLLLFFSLVLWLNATRLSNRMFIAEKQITETITMSLNDVKSMVFLAIGLYLLVDTISPLVQTISSVYASLTNSIDPSSQTKVTMLRITTTLKIGIGLWLVFGNKGLTNILKKIRNE